MLPQSGCAKNIHNKSGIYIYVLLFGSNLIAYLIILISSKIIMEIMEKINMNIFKFK